MAVAHVRGFDHAVLVVGDVEAAITFYTGTLGLAPERVDAWRAGEAPFPSVRVDAATVLDLLPRADGVDRGDVPNVDHLCLVVDDGTDLAALAAGGELDVVSGPSRVWGAQGMGEGLYVRDPDGNVVELRTYPPA